VTDTDKPLQEWDERDLKATAFDELSKLESIKRNISAIQQELARRHEQANTVKGSAPRKEPGSDSVA